MVGAVLTEDMVLSSARATSLDEVVNFNCWGMDLADLKILERMPQVEVLSLSINRVETLRHFKRCTALRELYLRRNKVASFAELAHVTDLTNLKVLWLSHNPVADHELYRATVIRTLPSLQKLDDTDVTDEEREAAMTKGLDVVALADAEGVGADDDEGGDDDDDGGNDDDDDEGGDADDDDDEDADGGALGALEASQCKAVLRAVLGLLPLLDPASLAAVVDSATALAHNALSARAWCNGHVKCLTEPGLRRE